MLLIRSREPSVILISSRNCAYMNPSVLQVGVSQPSVSPCRTITTVATRVDPGGVGGTLRWTKGFPRMSGRPSVVDEDYGVGDPGPGVPVPPLLSSFKRPQGGPFSVPGSTVCIRNHPCPRRRSLRVSESGRSSTSFSV